MSERVSQLVNGQLLTGRSLVTGNDRNKRVIVTVTFTFDFSFSFTCMFFFRCASLCAECREKTILLKAQNVKVR